MPWPAPPRPPIAPDALAAFERRCHRGLVEACRAEPFDLVNSQGGFFHPAAAEVALPVLFSLHLARRLYPADLIASRPANLHFQCVSHSQAAGYGAACCGVVANGIDVGSFSPRREPAAPDAPLLYLGRMCAEKGTELAVALARRLRRRLWLVGEPGPFPSHQQYFAEKIAPHLGPQVRWIAPPSSLVKRALLRAAAAVVIPSRIEETSSLVAMEAAASGVPVLALRRGALSEIVAEGETGWLADNVDGLVHACRRLPEIDPRACRARAEACFGVAAMVAGYRRLYSKLTTRIESDGDPGSNPHRARAAAQPVEHGSCRPCHGQLRPARFGAGRPL
ncbi:MAG: glycosyltransferase [Terriglobales bacterium]